MTETAQPLGEILIQRGLIGPDDLDRALELQRERHGEKLGRILVDMGFLAQRDLLSTLSQQLGLPIAQLAAPPSAPETEGLSPRFLRQALIFPLAVDEGSLTLAMADPLDFETINAVQNSVKLEVRPQFASEQDILDAIDRYYPEGGRQSPTADFAGGDEEDLEHLRDMASEAPVIRLVNAMIAQAIEKRSSDIHIEPFEKEFRIRFRIDGVLFNQEQPPRELESGDHLAAEADGEAEYRGETPSAGRTHQTANPGTRGGPSRFHASHALRRERRDATP